MDSDTIKYEYLSTDIFSNYDTHLVFTGVTRNSKTILKDITANLDKVYPLLGGVDKAYKHLKEKKYEKFLNDVSKGWKQKKKTSPLINENERIKQIDATLSANETVLSHKLCGAGNGGFFLTFSKKDTLTIPYHTVKIKVVSDGVKGESI